MCRRMEAPKENGHAGGETRQRIEALEDRNAQGGTHPRRMDVPVDMPEEDTPEEDGCNVGQKHPGGTRRRTKAPRRTDTPKEGGCAGGGIHLRIMCTDVPEEDGSIRGGTHLRRTKNAPEESWHTTVAARQHMGSTW